MIAAQFMYRGYCHDLIKSLVYSGLVLVVYLCIQERVEGKDEEEMEEERRWRTG